MGFSFHQTSLDPLSHLLPGPLAPCAGRCTPARGWEVTAAAAQVAPSSRRGFEMTASCLFCRRRWGCSCSPRALFCFYGEILTSLVPVQIWSNSEVTSITLDLNRHLNQVAAHSGACLALSWLSQGAGKGVGVVWGVFPFPLFFSPPCYMGQSFFLAFFQAVDKVGDCDRAVPALLLSPNPEGSWLGGLVPPLEVGLIVAFWDLSCPVAGGIALPWMSLSAFE